MYELPTSIAANAGFIGYLQYLNNVTENWFVRIFILSIWLVIVIGYYKARDDISASLAIASFVCFIIGLLAWLSSFLDGITFGIITAITIITAMLLFADRGNS